MSGLPAGVSWDAARREAGEWLSLFGSEAAGLSEEEILSTLGAAGLHGLAHRCNACDGYGGCAHSGRECSVCGGRGVVCVNGCEGIDPAAVPDLVAALERIEAAGDWRWMAKQARVALAKARGEG